MKFLNLVKAFVLSSFFILLIEACSDVHALEKNTLRHMHARGQVPQGLTKVEWANLRGWQSDNLQGALAAFKNSLPKLMEKEESKWDTVDNTIGFVVEDDTEGVRGFFQTHFEVYQISSLGEVCVTSFSEEEVFGSPSQDNTFRYPIYTDRNNPLYYLDSPVDRYFLNIQGRGHVNFIDGSSEKIMYTESNNGKSAFKLATWASENESLSKPRTGNREGYKAWFNSNRSDAESFFSDSRQRELYFQNASNYGGVLLTPNRSVAIDPMLKGVIHEHGIAFISGASHPGGEVNRLVFAQNSVASLNDQARFNIYAGADTAWAEKMNSKASSVHVILPKGYFSN